jgi:geranylgeranyl pyrophosphate synthase
VETTSLNDPRRGVDSYVETIRLKTAALFRASCELGASTAAADDLSRMRLIDYGENLGLAFQVVDDVLDLVGEPETIGKMPGTDLREGVFTAPVLLACERDGDLGERLSSGERGLDQVVPVLRATGALDEAVEMAAAYGRRARGELDGLPDGPWRDSLDSLVTGVLDQLDRAPTA